MSARTVKFNMTSKRPIRVEMVNADDPDHTYVYDIRSSADMSARERKAVQDIVRAVVDFEQIPESELEDADYFELERMMEDAIQMGTRNLDLTTFRSFSFPDRLTITISLGASVNEENTNRAEFGQQMRRVKEDVEGNDVPGGLFRRMMRRPSGDTSKPPVSLVTRSEDDPENG